MHHAQSSWPLDGPEHLADALREQEATPAEIDDLTPALLRLSEWQAPQPTPADTRRLLARLAPALPAVSPVRQAIRARNQNRSAALAALLETARVQVSIFRPAFWLASAAVILLGALAILLGDQVHQPHGSLTLLDQSLLLRAIGPLLAYLGATTAFRGSDLRVLEFELACQPSPVQLMLARLVIMLGYDLGLGLLLSLLLWLAGEGGFLVLTLDWLMPLLLVAGLALLLSLRLRVYTAAGLVYSGWLAVLVLDSSALGPFISPPIPLSPGTEVLLGVVGLALLAIALLRVQASTPHLVPRS
jgi:hypothetical protein